MQIERKANTMSAGKLLNLLIVDAADEDMEVLRKLLWEAGYDLKIGKVVSADREVHYFTYWGKEDKHEEGNGSK